MRGPGSTFNAKDTVGTTLCDELRPVVEHEQCVVLFAHRAKLLGRVEERLDPELLLAQLDDVDAASQRRGEQRAWILTMRPRLDTTRGELVAIRARAWRDREPE